MVSPRHMVSGWNCNQQLLNNWRPFWRLLILTEDTGRDHCCNSGNNWLNSWWGNNGLQEMLEAHDLLRNIDLEMLAFIYQYLHQNPWRKNTKKRPCNCLLVGEQMCIHFKVKGVLCIMQHFSMPVFRKELLERLAHKSWILEIKYKKTV